jgi:hypothetical protein
VQKKAFNDQVKKSDIILETGEGKRPMWWEYSVKG